MEQVSMIGLDLAKNVFQVHGADERGRCVINRLRATLGEFGIAVPSGPARLKQWFRDSYGINEDQLPVLMQRHIERMRARCVELERCIGELDREIDQHVQHNSACQRLLEVPGIGRLTASALVATVGNALAFKNGRQLSAWLGLVPRQHSSGGKTVLRGISKRGDAYLRRMLVHGARAVLRLQQPRKMPLATGYMRYQCEQTRTWSL